MGAFTAMSIVQGGPGLPIFSEAVLEYFSFGKVTGAQIEPDDLPFQLKYLFDEVAIIIML